MTDERSPLPLELTFELDRIRRRSVERPAKRRRGGLPRTAASEPKPRATDTHCAHGHPWSENEYRKPSAPGTRRCRACMSEQTRRARSGAPQSSPEREGEQG